MGDMGRFVLTEDRDRWRAFLNVVMDFRVP
jgi:hypothetical protein